MSRLDWNLSTSVGDYQQAGFTDAKWDGAAKRALTEFAHLRMQSAISSRNEHSVEIIRTNCGAAIDAGCNDPMIAYLNLRFDARATEEDPMAAYCDTARVMQKSSYHNIRKFYACIRAAETMSDAYGSNALAMPPYAEMLNCVPQNLIPAIQDPNLPPEEAYEACKEALHAVDDDASRFLQTWSQLETTLANTWPNEAVVWMLKGETTLRLAGSPPRTTDTNEWTAYSAKISEARDDLQKAWQFDSKDARIASIMIRVDEELQAKPDDVDLWFNRAMALDTNDYDACKNKLHFIFIQSHGDRVALAVFGRECVNSTAWGGYVPLTMIDAHNDYAQYGLSSDADRAAYWKQPEVWADVKLAYDKFFALNPDAAGIYRNYALNAYQAGQWAIFNQIASKVPPGDYGFFGGKDAFAKMVETAKAGGRAE